MEIRKPFYEQIPFDGKTLLPMDKVILNNGSEAKVNSAHYLSNDGRQMFSICGADETLYYSDETTFVHRHYYELKGFAYVCECGEPYLTMADFISRDKDATLN